MFVQRFIYILAFGSYFVSGVPSYMADSDYSAYYDEINWDILTDDIVNYILSSTSTSTSTTTTTTTTTPRPTTTTTTTTPRPTTTTTTTTPRPTTTTTTTTPRPTTTTSTTERYPWQRYTTPWNRWLQTTPTPRPTTTLRQTTTSQSTTTQQSKYGNASGVDPKLVYLPLIGVLVIIMLIVIYIITSILTRKYRGADNINVLWNNFKGRFTSRNRDETNPPESTTEDIEAKYTSKNIDNVVVNCNETQNSVVC
ncbi:uncharacterized membrane protein DDB_G0293934 [Bicyclus anynana]|uniref:Uncharacterized membrane protein DDB_G0293934 n=1 Tax=Bicyclus anynana TaxID=110368 RepID=A0A6J1NJL4_BICAN|nr:uncharacterized membrane protein DDB_G0293934 [Bicyclus anynana]